MGSDGADILTLYRTYKSETEKQAFLQAQVKAVIELEKKNAQLIAEIEHLKQLLTSTTQLIGDSNVAKIIVTPEEALIEEQISIIQKRSIGEELDLEDVKKLDILLRNKSLMKKDNAKTMDGKPQQLMSNAKLLEIAKSDNAV